ncbi:sensor histidine kinase [Ruminococcus sp. 5_1_39BFAA]|uniref:sensor histidine kinase n=1 Tax=Ruminococcus sp. 5_1_39BFAA TaxID=457412 RepID=UPI003561BDD6
MLDLIEFFANLMISMAFGYLIFLNIGTFLTARWTHPFVSFLIVCLLFGTSNIVVYPSELTGIVGFFFPFMLILVLCYNDEWYLKVSTAILIFPVDIAINYITQDAGLLIWCHLFHKSMSPVAETALHTATMFLRIPIWYAIYYCVRTWIPYTVQFLTRRMWLVLDLIAMTSFIGIITVIYNTSPESSYTAYPTCIACIVTTLGCCYLCTYMARNVKADMELQTYQYQQSYYRELDQNQQTVRRLRHDMKNHLNIIHTFLSNKEYTKAEDYLQDLNQEFVTHLRIYCPNSIVNAVLNSKEQLASESHIPCDFQIDLAESPAIEDMDLCSILGNTLDNAIEACRKIPETSRRFISVKARCKNGYFSCEIVNSKVNVIQNEKGAFLTDKKDASAHGIGLKTVKNLVDKYDGTIDISYDTDTFCITMMIRTALPPA